MFEVGEQPVSHPFDGAGLVSSIAIKGGRAFFRSRYVETAEYDLPVLRCAVLSCAALS